MPVAVTAPPPTIPAPPTTTAPAPTVEPEPIDAVAAVTEVTLTFFAAANKEVSRLTRRFLGAY